ncbi:MAG TPA: DUF4256 domain-containing protein [Candidatus Limiplasma sp.]|nr:DUF4256 domain-containing protein [Candidatus Limiplasma sp.]
MPETITSAQRDALLQTLSIRFADTARLHPALRWEQVKTKLEAAPERLAALHAMEATGGEPNVVPDPEHPQDIVFMDCAAESPAGRRSVCYDEDARLSRKANAPADSAEHMAETMGITLLSQAQYRALQTLLDLDLKTSSWVRTPQNIRSLGGALFCDKRYGQVFLYHNGADSYYASRGFRGFLIL